MSLQFNGTNGITYPNGTLQSTAYTGSSSGGGGGGDYTPEAMVWEDKKAERGFDTLYTNTNDVPLYVQIYCYTLGSEAAENWKFEIDGVNFGYNGVNTVGSINQTPMFIIPAGSTYKAVLDAGFPVISKWNEALMPVAVGTGGGGTGDAYTKEESDAIDNAQDVKIVINNDDIARQQIEITNNTAEIGKNTSAINTNIINIAQNSEYIAELQDSIFFSSAYSANYPSAANRDPEDGNMYLQAFALFTYSYESATQIFCSKTDEAGNVRQFTAIKAGDSVVLNEVDSPNYGRYELVSIEEVSESYVVMNVTPKLGEGTIVAGAKVAFQAFPKVGLWDENESNGYGIYPNNLEINGGVDIGSAANGKLSNTMLGRNASGQNAGASAFNNVSVGDNAFAKMSGAQDSVAVGSQAMKAMVSGDNNTAIGSRALSINTNGNSNVAIGAFAGATLAGGDNNILIGHNAAPSAPTVSNEVTIGNNDTTTIRMGNGDILYPSSGGGGGIPEAPVDGKQYGRQDAEWTEVVGGGGGSTDGYTKAEINAQQSAQDVKINKNYDDILYLETKADTNLAYIADNVEAIAKNTADIAALPPYVDAYSKTATDTLLDAKANKEDTYTKAETDAEIAAAGGGGGTGDGVWTEVDGVAVYDGTIDVKTVESYNDITIGPYEYNLSYGMKVGHGSGGYIDYLGRPVPISSNVAIGYETLIGGTLPEIVNTGQNIVAIGYGALRANLNGNNNVAVGHTALKANTSGQDNTAVGVTASLGNTTGRNNSSFGKSALQDNREGDYNTGIGIGALGSTLGDFNTALGARAGLFLVSGSNNTMLGYEARASSNTVSNEITLGNADVTTVRMGNGDVIYSASVGAVATYSTEEVDKMLAIKDKLIEKMSARLDKLEGITG